MPKHPHSENMMLYAQDAMETDRPWERWETNGGRGWENLCHHPCWSEDCKYRRKPRTIAINGVEVPEPMRERPAKGEWYWLVDFEDSSRTVRYLWGDDPTDNALFNAGVIHATEEAAFAHAKALIRANHGGES